MFGLNLKTLGIVALAFLVATGGAYALGNRQGDAEGYRRAALEWTVKYEQRENELLKRLFDELDRQAYANDLAKEQERRELEVMREHLAVMAKLAEDLAREAAADKDAARIALNADAVERYRRRIAR